MKRFTYGFEDYLVNGADSLGIHFDSVVGNEESLLEIRSHDNPTIDSRRYLRILAGNTNESDTRPRGLFKNISVNSGSGNEIWYGFRCRISAVGNQWTRVALSNHNSGGAWALCLAPNLPGGVGFRTTATTWINLGTEPSSEDLTTHQDFLFNVDGEPTWRNIAIRFKQFASPQMTVFIDGIEHFTTGTIANVLSVLESLQQIGISGFANTTDSSAERYVDFDDFWIDYDHLTNFRIAPLKPQAIGSYDQGNPSEGSDKLAMVNQFPPDPSTHITLESDQSISFTLQELGLDKTSVYGLKLNFSVGGPTTYSVFVKSGTKKIVVGEFQVYGETPQKNSISLRNNPITKKPWTRNDLETVEIGFAGSEVEIDIPQTIVGEWGSNPISIDDIHLFTFPNGGTHVSIRQRRSTQSTQLFPSVGSDVRYVRGSSMYLLHGGALDNGAVSKYTVNLSGSTPTYVANWTSDPITSNRKYGCVSNGEVTFVHSENTGICELLDDETGELIWNTTVSGIVSWSEFRPAIAAGKIWLPMGNVDTLKVLSLEDGLTLDTLTFGGGRTTVAENSPGGQFVYIGSNNRVYKVDSDTHEILAQTANLGDDTGFVLLSSKQAFLQVGNSQAYILDLDTMFAEAITLSNLSSQSRSHILADPFGGLAYNNFFKDISEDSTMFSLGGGARIYVMPGRLGDAPEFWLKDDDEDATGGGPAGEGSPAITEVGSVSVQGNTGQRGWAFTVGEEDVVATHFGLYIPSARVDNVQSKVSLWDWAAGTLIEEVWVEHPTADEFHYAPLETQLTLSASTKYAVSILGAGTGSSGSSSSLLRTTSAGPPGFVFDERITYNHAAVLAEDDFPHFETDGIYGISTLKIA